MPGDPKAYRERAKRCLQIAHEATNPALKVSLEEIAQQWLRLAADFEATKPLLEAWGDPSLSAKLGIGWRGLTSSRRFSENDDQAETELITSVGAEAFHYKKQQSVS